MSEPKKLKVIGEGIRVPSGAQIIGLGSRDVEMPVEEQDGAVPLSADESTEDVSQLETIGRGVAENWSLGLTGPVEALARRVQDVLGGTGVKRALGRGVNAPAVGPKTYHQHRMDVAHEYERAREANPKTAMATDVAATLLHPLNLIGAGSLRAGEGVAAKAAPTLGRQLAGQAAGSAAVGGAVGAATSTGANPQEVATDALKGAGYGAAVVPAFRAGAKMAGRALPTAAGALAAQAAAPLIEKVPYVGEPAAVMAKGLGAGLGAVGLQRGVNELTRPHRAAMGPQGRASLEAMTELGPAGAQRRALARENLERLPQVETQARKDVLSAAEAEARAPIVETEKILQEKARQQESLASHKEQLRKQTRDLRYAPDELEAERFNENQLRAQQDLDAMKVANRHAAAMDEHNQNLRSIQAEATVDFNNVIRGMDQMRQKASVGNKDKYIARRYVENAQSKGLSVPEAVDNSKNVAFQCMQQIDAIEGISEQLGAQRKAGNTMASGAGGQHYMQEAANKYASQIDDIRKRLSSPESASIEKQAEGVAEMFKTMDQFKYELNKIDSVYRQREPLLMEKYDSAFGSVRSFLENPQVWGAEAASMQQNLNKQLHAYIQISKPLSTNLLSEITGSPEAASGRRSLPGVSDSKASTLISGDLNKVGNKVEHAIQYLTEVEQSAPMMAEYLAGEGASAETVRGQSASIVESARRARELLEQSVMVRTQKDNANRQMALYKSGRARTKEARGQRDIEFEERVNQRKLQKAQQEADLRQKMDVLDARGDMLETQQKLIGQHRSDLQQSMQSRMPSEEQVYQSTRENLKKQPGMYEARQMKDVMGTQPVAPGITGRIYPRAETVINALNRGEATMNATAPGRAIMKTAGAVSRANNAVARAIKASARSPMVGAFGGQMSHSAPPKDSYSSADRPVGIQAASVVYNLIRTSPDSVGQFQEPLMQAAATSDDAFKREHARLMDASPGYRAMVLNLLGRAEKRNDNQAAKVSRPYSGSFAQEDNR